MKRLLTLILVLISVASFAWPNAKQIEVRPGSMLGWDNASATWRPLAVGPDTGALVTDAEVTIGSITMETTIVPVTEWETQTVIRRKTLLPTLQAAGALCISSRMRQIKNIGSLTTLLLRYQRARL